MTIHVTLHAAERYRERVEPALTVPEAISRIRTAEKAVECAAGFGCSTVRLGNGAKLILDGVSVVTVLSNEQRHWMSRAARQSLGFVS
jgi:predicted O-methyltransferase YrrM